MGVQVQIPQASQPHGPQACSRASLRNSPRREQDKAYQWSRAIAMPETSEPTRAGESYRPDDGAAAPADLGSRDHPHMGLAIYKDAIHSPAHPLKDGHVPETRPVHWVSR